MEATIRENMVYVDEASLGKTFNFGEALELVTKTVRKHQFEFEVKLYNITLEAVQVDNTKECFNKIYRFKLV